MKDGNVILVTFVVSLVVMILLCALFYGLWKIFGPGESRHEILPPPSEHCERLGYKKGVDCTAGRD